MKINLIKTGLIQDTILYQIPSEILDPIEVDFINCYKLQKLITDKPTLKTIAQELLPTHKDPATVKALLAVLIKAEELSKAEWEIALFKARSQATNKLIQQLAVLDDDDQKGRSQILTRILELGKSKDVQYMDPINATQWEELCKAEEEEINVSIDWFNKNDVALKKKVLYAFIATTNGGKTILKTWFAHKIIEAGKNVLYLAQEEPKEDTIRRIHQISLGITESQYIDQTKDGFKPVRDRYVEHANKHGYGEFLVAEWAGIKIDSIAEWLKTYAEQHETKIDAVIIDYGKLVETSMPKKNSQEWERIGLIFAELKQLAMKLNIAVITSIQLNRESSQKLVKDGTMADLFDVAGAFEATHHVNYCWSVRLEGKLADDIDYNDINSTQGLYTLQVQKQKYGKLRKGDRRSFHWHTDHSLQEVMVDIPDDIFTV